MCGILFNFTHILLKPAGIDALSSFGEQFFESIDKLHSDCVRAREQSMSELEQVKQEMEEYRHEMKQLFPSVDRDGNTKQERIQYQEVRKW